MKTPYSMMKKSFILIFMLAALSACATSGSYKDLEQQAVNAEFAGKYAHLAMMSSNSYHKDEKKRDYFPIEKMDWQHYSMNGELTDKPDGPTFEDGWNGLAYDIYKKKNTKETVFAYRGTEGFWDWIFSNLALFYSPAYTEAFEKFEEYKNSDEHKDEKIMVTGHSLGGGIALGVSVRNEGVKAVVFDPSPRIFNGLEDHNKPATRIVVYQEKEILEYVRKGWTTIPDILQPEDPKDTKIPIYKATCPFKKGESNHRGDLLAKCLLEKGQDDNMNLKPVWEEVK
jgi:hypothetical protein